MKKSFVVAITILSVMGISAWGQGDVDKVTAKRDAIDTMAQEALQRLMSESDKAAKLYESAVAYAVFDNFKVAVGISGGGGVGVAVDKADDERTYMKMGTGGIGLGLGGQSYQVVFLFENDQAFRNFVDRGWQADASANAVAGTTGKNVDATFTHGLAVFQLTNKGLMAQADISGTKYWKHKKLNN